MSDIKLPYVENTSNNLALLREALKPIADEDRDMFDAGLIGVLSTRITEEEWKYCLAAATRVHNRTSR